MKNNVSPKRKKCIFKRNQQQTGIRPNLISRSRNVLLNQGKNSGGREMMEDEIRAENM